ncbi:hypothetical protein [Halovivax limisalsi]|uniref:hypothetical protein n=1 Tax=Halovivax limisalsi TaxID=1453760 RepID=UPI001FFCE63A|nr:hypothetical protein [Halovivax limisalsi]
MNRRNVLAGLGGIVAGGGALLGTGAFSTVSADRTVTVSTADDDSGSALVGFSPTSSYASVSSGTLQLDLSNVNLDATVTLTGVFDIVNNHSAQIALNSPWTVSANGISVTLTPGSSTVASGSSTAVDVEIVTDGAASGASLNQTVTIDVTA